MLSLELNHDSGNRIREDNLTITVLSRTGLTLLYEGENQALGLSLDLLDYQDKDSESDLGREYSFSWEKDFDSYTLGAMLSFKVAHNRNVDEPLVRNMERIQWEFWFDFPHEDGRIASGVTQELLTYDDNNIQINYGPSSFYISFQYPSI